MIQIEAMKWDIFDSRDSFMPPSFLGGIIYTFFQGCRYKQQILGIISIDKDPYKYYVTVMSLIITPLPFVTKCAVSALLLRCVT